MMNRGTRLVVASLVLAACGTGAQPAVTTASTSTTAEPERSTTTTAAASEVRPFETGRPTRFESGARYRFDAALVPVEVELSKPGWYSDVTTEVFVAFLNQTDASISANIAFLYDRSVEELTAELTALAISVDGPTEVELGGLAGLRLDLAMGVQEYDPDNSRDSPCNDAWTFRPDFEQGEISQWTRKQLGALSACGWSRVWMLEYQDTVVVVNVSRMDATTDPIGTLVDIQSHADDLAAGLRFCVDGSGC